MGKYDCENDDGYWQYIDHTRQYLPCCYRYHEDQSYYGLYQDWTYDKYRNQFCTYHVSDPTKEAEPETPEDIIDDLEDTLSGVAKTVAGWLEDTLDSIKEWFRGLIDGIKDWIGGVLDSLRSVLETIGDWIKNILRNIKTAISTFLSAVKKVIDAVWGWLKAGLERIGQWIVTVYETVRDAIVRIGENIAAVVKAVYEWLKNGFEVIGTWIETTYKRIAEWIKGVYETIANWIKGAVSDIGAWIVQAFQDIMEWVLGAWAKITASWEAGWEANRQFLVGDAKNLRDVLQANVDNLKLLITSPAQFVAETIELFGWATDDAIAEILTSVMRVQQSVMDKMAAGVLGGETIPVAPSSLYPGEKPGL